MVLPTTDTQEIRYNTIEQRRANVQRALLRTPNDPHLRKLLTTLCTPQQMQYAAREGVFMSYSRVDELFAFDLADDLRARGVDVWLDMVDVTYDQNGDWDTEVLSALSRCGLMLWIVSAEGMDDRAVCAERDYFIDSGKIVLPVIYRHETVALDGYLPPMDFRHQLNPHSLSQHIPLQTLTRLLKNQA